MSYTIEHNFIPGLPKGLYDSGSYVGVVARSKKGVAFEKRICVQCGKHFIAKVSEIKRGGGKFCSISCGTTYRNIRNNPAKSPEVRAKIKANHAHLSGEKHPNFGKKGVLASGYIDGRHSYSKGHSYRGIALANKEHKCEVCGKELLINEIEVHHKDKNRKNNDLCNLIIACHNCHRTTLHEKFKRNERGQFLKREGVRS